MPGPNLLIIGAARSGTTALAGILAQHPEVFVTDPKETHFLAHAERPTAYTGPGDDLTVNRFLVTDPAEYAALYADAGEATVRAEGSVSTLYHPDRAIEAIRRFADPDVRLVAILREPADRALSSYLYLRGRGFETCETFEEALELEERRREDGYQHMFHLRAMSRYGRQLPPFADAFGDRLKVLILEEYRDDPAGHLRELCRFVGIDPDFAFATDLEVNRGGQPRSRLMAEAMNRLRASEGLRTLVRATVPEAARERIRQTNLQRTDGDPATMAALRSEFAGDVAAVESVLGRPVGAWVR